MKNKYIHRSKISEAKFREIVRLFSVDLNVVQITRLFHPNRNTVNRPTKAIRKIITHSCEKEFPVAGEVEVDESYTRRVKGVRGWGAKGKTIVFGLIKQQGRVYTEIVPDYSRTTLQGIILRRIDLENVRHSDGWKGYDGLVDVGYDRHLRVNKSKSFVEHGVHINGIEAFWSFTTRRLTKFNGAKANFHLHLRVRTR